MRWLLLGGFMESWLGPIDLVGRHTGYWSCIPGSTGHCENEWKTDNLGWMLHSVYAVLGVNWWSWHGEIQRDELNLCFAMMVELRMQKGNGWWRWEHYVDYKQIWDIRGTTLPIRFRRPNVSVLTCHIRSATCHIRKGKLTCTQNSRKSQFLTIISPISSHLSHSCPQLYYYLSMQTEVIPLYLSIQ